MIMGMKAIWIVPVIASILILGALGIGITQPTANIEAQTDSYQYVPFKISGPSSTVTCNDINSGEPFNTVFIQSVQDRDFLITSIFMKPSGSHIGDSIVFFVNRIDGIVYNSVADVGAFSAFSVDQPFELLGVPSSFEKFSPKRTSNQIGLSGNDGLSGLDKDLVLVLGCFQGAPGEIKFQNNRIAVTGWKHVDDTITLTYT